MLFFLVMWQGLLSFIFFSFLYSSLFFPLYVCSLIYCMYAVTFLSMSVYSKSSSLVSNELYYEIKL